MSFSKPKLLFCSSGLRGIYGGPAFSEGLLCQQLAKTCELTIIAKSDKVDREFCAKLSLPHVHTFGFKDIFAAFLSKKSWLAQLFEQAELFHTNGHWKLEQYFLTRLAKRYQVPYLFHPRGMLLVGHKKVLLKRVYNLLLGNRMVRDASRLIALSDFEKRHFRPYPVSEAKIVKVPNSIETPRDFQTTGAPDGDYYLYLGRIEPRKQLLFLVEAFSYYVNRGGNGSLFLVGPVERNHDVELDHRIVELGLGDKVKILPAIFGDQKWAYLSRARAVIYPAKEEPFGRVPFEAIAVGCFPLVPDESGGAEYLQNLLPGSVYDGLDPKSLAERMLAVDKKRPDLAPAQQWIASHLNPEAIANQMFHLYEEVLHQPHR